VFIWIKGIVTTQISDPGSGGVTEMASEPIVINLRNDRALGIINATIIIRRTPIEFMVGLPDVAPTVKTRKGTLITQYSNLVFACIGIRGRGG
jgi:hypothetical protein